eukprot:2257416-Pyramimonas_sp.AAC.1
MGTDTDLKAGERFNEKPEGTIRHRLHTTGVYCIALTRAPMMKLHMRRVNTSTRSNMMILDAQGPLRLLTSLPRRPKM